MTTSANYRRWLYVLVVLLTIIAGLYLSGWIYGVLRACGDILALYFMAWLLQFFFAPVVDYLTRHHVPRLLAVCYVYLVVALLVVIGLIAVVPAIYSQGQQLAAKLNERQTYEVITSVTRGIENFLVQHLSVPKKQIDQFTQGYSVSLRNGAFSVGQQLGAFLRGHLTPSNISSSAATFLGFLNTISTWLLDFVIVLILAFYMTLDGPKLMRRALSYFPPAVDEVMESVYAIVNRKFAGYLRGQIILAFSYGLLTYIIARGFGLPYQIFIAIFAAIMMLIPFIGTFAAVVPPLLAFIFVHATAPHPSFPVGTFLLLLVFLVVAQQVVLNVLAPRVMGTAVGMHPLLVVLGLLLGIKVAGLWGAIFGVPVFGVLIETADLVYRRVVERRFGFHPPGPANRHDGAMQGPTPAVTPGVETSKDAPPPVEETAPALPRAGATLQPSRPHESRP